MKSIENKIGTKDFRKQSRLAFGRRQGTWRRTSILLSTVCVPLFILFFSLPAFAVDYYVDSAAGSDTDNSGQTEQQPFQTLQKVASLSLSPGDSVFLKRGSSWEEGLETSSSGDSQNRIIISTYGIGENPVIRYLRVKGDYTTIRGLTIDRNKEASDAVQVEEAANCSLEYLNVKNGTRDGIDAYHADNLLIENCVIHHFLNGSFSVQADAHGIVVAATDGVTIRETEVHHVSGDCFQADPNRVPADLTNNILIENCHFWTGPLTEDFNAGWVKTSHLAESERQYPGENAIDTKVLKEGWETSTRMQITIDGCQFHGWAQDGYISNKAALNLKEKIEATVSDTIVYDCEIGFRLRGGLGNANVTISDTNLYSCNYGIRTEDNLENLKVSNTVFGSYLGEKISVVNSSTGFETWDIRDSFFSASIPDIVTDPTNEVISHSQWRVIRADLPEPEIVPPYNLRIASLTSDESDMDDTSDPTTDSNQEIDDDSNNTSDTYTGTAPVESGAHPHFVKESQKTGVVFSRSYRSQSEIDSAWFTYETTLLPCLADGSCEPYGDDRGVAYYGLDYSATESSADHLDGAVMPVIYNIDLGQLRHPDTFITDKGSDAWVQFEIYLAPNFYDIPFKTNTDGLTWGNLKLVRIVASEDGWCPDKIMATLYRFEDIGDRIGFRAHCGLGEDTENLTDYVIPAGKWIRLTQRFGFTDNTFDNWATNLETGSTIQILQRPLPDGVFSGDEQLTNCWVQLQSTALNHHGSEKQDDTFIAFRNFIVSNDEISRTSN